MFRRVKTYSCLNSVALAQWLLSALRREMLGFLNWVEMDVLQTLHKLCPQTFQQSGFSRSTEAVPLDTFESLGRNSADLLRLIWCVKPSFRT